MNILNMNIFKKKAVFLVLLTSMISVPTLFGMKKIKKPKIRHYAHVFIDPVRAKKNPYYYIGDFGIREKFEMRQEVIFVDDQELAKKAKKDLFERKSDLQNKANALQTEGLGFKIKMKNNQKLKIFSKMLLLM